MNTLLDITGSLLYLALSIILFPLFLFVEGLIFSVVLYRNTRMMYRQLLKRMQQHPYRVPRIDMALKRGWVSIMANRH